MDTVEIRIIFWFNQRTILHFNMSYPGYSSIFILWLSIFGLRPLPWQHLI